MLIGAYKPVMNRESFMSGQIAVRQALLGLAVASCTMSSVSPTKAGDLYEPPYLNPYPAPSYQRLDRERYGITVEGHRGAEVGYEICRILHERRVDPYGREVIHRIRMCDEGPAYLPPDRVVVPQVYGYPPRQYYQRSGYYPYPPRPPASIGHGYYN